MTALIKEFNKESSKELNKGLSKEQIAEEERWLEGLPRINWGALIMPAIWGPAHGFWVCILFYPLYVFIDNLIFSAYRNPEPWIIALAVLAVVLMLALSIAFSLISQPYAAHRAESKGVSRAHYLKRERVWAIVSIIIALVALIWASYYNLAIRAAAA